MKKLLSALLALSLALSLIGGALAETTWDSENLAWKTNKDPITFSVFHNMTWAPMDVWGEDHVSQQVTADTGISFEVTKQSDSSQLATYVATGELPDAVFVFGAANIDLMEDYDVCYAWDELIAEYAPEFMDLIDPTDIQMATKEDGHFYTLYTHMRNQQYWDDPTQGVSYGEGTISFRQDILDALGNPTIESTEDFYNVLKQVKEKYPDMIPYLQPNANGAYLAHCFGIDYDSNNGYGTVNENGELIWVYADQEPLNDYVAFANKLVREGLMSQEALIYTQEETKAAIMAGNVFCYAGQCYDVDQWNEALAGVEGNTAYYTAIRKPLTVDGEIKMSQTYGQAGFAGFYITRNCEDPARLIALMEYMRSPYGDKLTQWGVEGLDYELVNGYPMQFDTYSWKERGDNVWYFQATFSVENQKALAAAAASEKYGQVAHLVTDFKPYWQYDVAQALIQNPDAGTYEGDVYATLDSLRLPSINAAITAASEEEALAKMADFYAACEKAGLADYNKFINDQYQAIKAGFAK